MNIYVIAFIIVQFILNIIILILYFRLNIKYKNFISKFDGNKNIEEELSSYLKYIEYIAEQNEITEKQISSLKSIQEESLCKIGINRYKLYDDTAQNTCFSLAILNDKDDGFILNQIYSQEMSHIYIKEINRGMSNEKLSKPERLALQNAVIKNKE